MYYGCIIKTLRLSIAEMSIVLGGRDTKITMNAKEKRITLKEAAEISGYSPDYLGQLIRKGKIPGEQVFANVAWVTTESSVREYLENAKKGTQFKKSTGQTLRQKICNEKQLLRMYTAALYVIIAMLCTFIVFLFFVFSVQLDKKMQENISLISQNNR